VWSSPYSGNRVSRIDPRTGKVVARIPTDISPLLSVAAAGSVWVAKFVGGDVSRIDPWTA
jgi:streptogramin lyase